METRANASSLGTPARHTDRLAMAILFGAPAVVLAASYVLLAFRHRTGNVFPVIVHESGDYTLLETIFYFRHFVREAPIDLFVAAAVAAAAWLHSPLPSASAVHRARQAAIRRWLGWSALAALALVLALTSAQLSLRDTWLELAQFHTRDDRVEFGSHWRYHLLHLADAVAFSVGSVYVARGLIGARTRRSTAWRWIGAWSIAFLLVTLAFGSPAQAFTDPLYLAHQAREIETHRVLSIWPALGFILLLERRLQAPTPTPVPVPRFVRIGLGWLVGATLIPGFIVWRLRDTNVMTLAQQQSDLWQLAAAHHFEHCLDYLFIAVLGGFLYLTLAGRPGTARARPAEPHE